MTPPKATKKRKARLRKKVQNKSRICDQLPEADLETVVFDMADLQAVDRAGKELREKYDSLHVLVNNAGALFKSRTQTKDGFEAHFGINYLAPFHLTNLLLPMLQQAQGARVINVASVNHKTGKIIFEDLACGRGYHWVKSYGDSKLANIYFTYELARRTTHSAIMVNALDPGIVSTNIFLRDGTLVKKLLGPVMDMLFLSPQQASGALLYLACDPELEQVSGKYFIRGRAGRSSPVSYNAEIAERLWDVSVELIKDKL